MDMTIIFILCLIIVFSMIIIYFIVNKKISRISEKLELVSKINDDKMTNTENNNPDQK